MSLGISPWDHHKSLNRKIPSSGESLPPVGLGTWRTFDIGRSPGEQQSRSDVLKTLVKLEAKVIDSSPMYGRSEEVVGDLSSNLQIRAKTFLATKVWTSGKDEGIAQMNRSIDKMKASTMDLMQIHNLVDWRTHMKTLLQWKEHGKIRYLGITHYLESAYPEMEKIMSHYPLDFVQFNYSVNSRQAEQRLLPLAADKGIAVIINRPFEGGDLHRQFKHKKLPSWTTEFDCDSWAQFFLKYILAHNSVTCVIPGTSQAYHLRENILTAQGKLPDAAQRKRMIDLVNSR